MAGCDKGEIDVFHLNCVCNEQTDNDALPDINIEVLPNLFMQNDLLLPASIIISNLSDERYPCGDNYGLEYCKNGEWVQILLFPNIAFTQEGHWIEPGGGKMILQLEFHLFDFDFTPGRYRVYHDHFSPKIYGEFYIVK
jgi:hypothetical protein